MVEKVDDLPSENGLTDIQDHPKLWPRSLKAVILFNICMMTFNGQFFAAGPATSLVYLVQEFRVGYPDVAPLISYVVLMIGISSLIWVPTTSVFGKRVVLIVSNFVFLIGCIWAIYAKSLNSLLGSRILGGFGAGAVQAIGPAVIGDVYFERDYSKTVSVYTMCLTIGAQMGPLFAGHIALHMGWRWIFRIIAILVGFNLLTAILLLPETSFTQSGSTGVTAGVLDEQLSEAASSQNHRKAFSTALREGILYLRHPHIQGGGIKQWVNTFSRHLPFIVDPIALCCAGLWGIVQSWVIVISVCSSQLFAPSPFLFTPAQLGNWTGTSMIGVIIAFPIAGPVVDLLSRKLSERRGGHQPEYRLYSMIVPFVVCSPGLLLFGYTFLKGSYIGPAVGFAMQAAGLTLAPSAAISYAIDSYPFHAAEAVASVNLLTHLMSFALSRTAPAWLLRVGVKQLFIDMSVIQWAVFIGLTLPLLLFGSWIRSYTTKLHAKIT
ncbi:major facilitator superfamily domain-containing protein [Boeremia exigua]|uniref:major facilitator superfamily domain-containing protein n=1 Tax=Boeremia exigua TaxID=749465 RepID=UPI001E8DEE7F|nr:major facilitator superfamily domain-containing protein [Boeremia exigua]KAH6618442.1 major facilitator superfamily domain-containing protein [Boeremia exigua]